MQPATSILLRAGLLLAACLCCCAGCGQRAQVTTPALSASLPLPAVADLPQLEMLPAPALRASSSPAQYNLLNRSPLVSSPGATVNWSFGNLTLVPGANPVRFDTAWAVFGIQGFPLDQSIVPLTISSDGGPLWLGLSNYALGRWEWRQVLTAQPWTESYANGADYVSPSGATYVALLKQSLFAQAFSPLLLSTSAGLFDQPEADIQLVSSNPTALWETVFDFSGSSAGDGIITSISFIPEAGAAAIDLGTDMPLPAAFSHTYDSPGTKQARLEIYDDLGGSGVALLDVNVVAPVRELLVVYNSNIPESEDLAQYYMSPLTGRAIDPGYALGLPLADSTSFTPNIPRAPSPGIDFEEDILSPLKAFLDAPANAQLKQNVKYLLLMKGVPHQVEGSNEFSTSSTYSSVDSELTLLYSYGQWPLAGWIWNGEIYQDFPLPPKAQSFHWQTDAAFQRGQFKASSSTATYDLDYLVGRIDAYTYDEAKLIIDRARAADTSGTGWVILDSFDNDPNSVGNLYDKMVQPVWPSDTPGELMDAITMFSNAGYLSVWEDITSTRLTMTQGTPPAGFVNSVIAYAGWGVNHGGGSYPSGNEYILNDVGWNYLPGACWISYESFNGTAFSEPINRRGQGQISDFLRRGGTCAIGNAWEPFTIGVGDERWIFYRYVVQGDRWIEAAYKGMCLLSWQEVVVGDPLCRVKP